MNRFLDLSDKALPILNSDPLCISTLNGSQVAEVFLVPFGLEPPDDWTNYDQWAALIDNQATNGYRRFAGIGGVPAPQNYQSTLPRLRGQRVNARGFELSIEVIGLSDENYALAQRFQLQRIDFRFWYVTVSKVIYGGDNGILPYFIDASTPQDSGRGEVEKAVFTLQYLSDASPNRSAVAAAGGIVDVEQQPRALILDDGTALTIDDTQILTLDTQ